MIRNADTPACVRGEPRIVQDAIDRYAKAYSDLQQLQEAAENLIPIGDQKTGCIGEFYVRLYLLSRFPDFKIRFGGHSQGGWDIEVTLPSGHPFRIQVKTVSAYSTTRRISPIGPGWDELLIVYLDATLRPAGFWIITDKSIVPTGNALKHCCSPRPGSTTSGSAAIPFGPNRISELLEAVNRAMAS